MLDAACIDRYPIVHLPLVSFSHFWSIVLVNIPVRNQQWTEHNLQKHAKINRTITNLAYNPALFAANEINKFAGLEEPLKLEWSMMTHVRNKKQTSFWWHTTFFSWLPTISHINHYIIHIIYIYNIHTCHEVYMTITWYTSELDFAHLARPLLQRHLGSYLDQVLAKRQSLWCWSYWPATI